jgi:hypothetical protein
MPRHDPIAEPRPVRPVVGRVIPLISGEHVDYRLLDRPTVVRTRAAGRVEAVRLYLLEHLGIDDADAAEEIVRIAEGR